MEILVAILVGVLFAAAIYLMLARNVVRILLGVLLLGNAVNLLLFAIGRMYQAVPPLIPVGYEALQPPYANPLPQALILTAIVIGFGLTAFALSLALRVFESFRTVDSDVLQSSEREESTS